MGNFRCFVGAISLLYSLDVFSADSCNALLNVGVYNISQTNSANEGKSLAKSTFCSADYSNNSTTKSQKGAIEASYGLFSGGASGSADSSEIIQAQKNVCTSGFNSSAYSNMASSYSQVMYQGALDAWNQCNSLAKDGVTVDIKMDSAMQGLTATFSTPVGVKAEFLGVTQIGLGASECTTLLNGKVTPVDEGTSINITSAKKATVICKRKMSADNSGNRFSDAHTLVFNTSSGPYQFPFSRTGSIAQMSVIEAKEAIKLAVEDSVKEMLKKSRDDSRSEMDSVILPIKNNVDNLKTSYASLSGALSGNGRIFGGEYQIDDCGREASINSVKNPMTDSYSCPSGFEKYKVGRILAPETKCGVEQYVCLRNYSAN